MGWEEGGSLQHTILLNCLKAVSKHPKHYGILIIVEAFFLLHTQLQRLVHAHSSEARLSVFLLPAQCSIDSLLRCHDSSHTNTITCCLIKPKKNIRDKRQTDHAHSANVQIDRQADRGTKIRLNTHGNNLHNVTDILFHITTDHTPWHATIYPAASESIAGYVCCISHSCCSTQTAYFSISVRKAE